MKLFWILLACLMRDGLAMEVLMVIGGRYLDHTRQSHVELASVELVGPRGVCRLENMPEARQGHSAGLMGDKVYVCGGQSGKHIHERKNCLTYSLTNKTWAKLPSETPQGLAFSAMAVGKNSLYLLGGRESLYMNSQDRPWEKRNVVMEYSRIRRKEEGWRFLKNLTFPGSDGCAGLVNNNLWYVGEQGVELLRSGKNSWEQMKLARIRNETLDKLLTLRGRVLPPPPPHIEDPEQIENSDEVTFQFQDPSRKKRRQKQRNDRRNDILHLTSPSSILSGGGLNSWQQGELDPRNSMTEERRRMAEEERRRKNQEILNQQQNKDKPSSIWNQIKNVFEKGTKNIDDIFGFTQNPMDHYSRRHKREVTRAPLRQGNGYSITRASFNPLDVQGPPPQYPINNRISDWGSGNGGQWISGGMGSVSGEPGKGGGVWRVRTENKDMMRPQENRSRGDNRRQDDRSRGENWRQAKQWDGYGGGGGVQAHPTRPSYTGGSNQVGGQLRQGGYGGVGSQGTRGQQVHPRGEHVPTRVPDHVRRAEERLVGQGCAQLDINEEEGIILAGGVWERGQKVAWVPLERPGVPLLEVIGTLEEPRRWRPGVGRIAGRLAIAGGGDWGSNTVEILDQDNRFKLLNHRLEERRENTAAVTVDTSFFPECRI